MACGRRINILGVEVDMDCSLQDVTDRIERAFLQDGSHYICTTNPEFIVAAECDPEFRNMINNADMSLPDGAGVVLADYYINRMRVLAEGNNLPKIAKIAKGLVVGLETIVLSFTDKSKFSPKITGVRLTEEIFKISAERGYSVFLLGGKARNAFGRVLKKSSKDVSLLTAEYARERYPGVNIIGASSTFSYKKEDDKKTTAYIQECMKKANIECLDFLLVAYGQKNQESWIVRNMKKILTIVVILGITSVLYLYTSGYRLDKKGSNAIDLSKTGMISAKSIPDGASVYLDGKLVTATDDTLPGIKPGKHKLTIEKKGFVPWTKEIEIYETLVTDITAVLVSQSPRLEPLTNTGARYPEISPSLTKIAFFSEGSEKPGIWVTALSGGIGLFRNASELAVQDTKFVKYSQGMGIEWSPTETQLLVQLPNNIFYLVDLATHTAQTIADPETIKEEWQKLLTEKRKEIVEKLDVPENIKQLALSPKAMWAPDDKKFLYTVQDGENLEYRTYSFERPIPVGEKIENTVFVTKVSDPQPQISWYSDSFHLILVEGNVEEEKRGVISLIRIDGTNKVEIYNNTLMYPKAFSAPSGDKVLILTSFKSGGQTDLYTVGIR